MKIIQATKITLIFEVISFNNANTVMQDKAIFFFSLFGIIKRIICFSQFKLIFEI